MFLLIAIKSKEISKTRVTQVILKLALLLQEWNNVSLRGVHCCLANRMPQVCFERTIVCTTTTSTE